MEQHRQNAGLARQKKTEIAFEREQKEKVHVYNENYRSKNHEISITIEDLKRIDDIRSTNPQFIGRPRHEVITYMLNNSFYPINGAARTPASSHSPSQNRIHSNDIPIIENEVESSIGIVDEVDQSANELFDRLVDDLEVESEGLDDSKIRLAVIERILRVICRISAEKLPVAISLVNLYSLLRNDSQMPLKRAIELSKGFLLFLRFQISLIISIYLLLN